MSLVTCDRCGMSFTRTVACKGCFSGLLGELQTPVKDCEVCDGGKIVFLREPHECPPPFPLEVARFWTALAGGMGGVIVDQRTRARVRLGLESAGDQ